MARSEEPSWYDAMKRQIIELRSLVRRPGIAESDVPLIIAGDVLDRWNPTNELINFILSHLPRAYAVPGQHDLMHHSYKDIRRTGYWTLVEAGKIINLEPGNPVLVEGSIPLHLHGFPWRTPIIKNRDPHDLTVEIAVIHQYIWIKGKGHQEASNESRLQSIRSNLRGYDVAVFGDNHIPFESRISNGCKVFNCGGFFRRRVDEATYRPSVGLLYSDMTMKRHYLDVSQDVFIRANKKGVEGMDIKEFLDDLINLGDKALNFADAVRQSLDKGVLKEVQDLALKLLGMQK